MKGHRDSELALNCPIYSSDVSFWDFKAIVGIKIFKNSKKTLQKTWNKNLRFFCHFIKGFCLNATRNCFSIGRFDYDCRICLISIFLFRSFLATNQFWQISFHQLINEIYFFLILSLNKTDALGLKNANLGYNL